MKTSIFTIALALLSFTNFAFAGNGNLKKSKPVLVYTDTTVALAPEALIDGTFEKSIENVIAADNQITESEDHEDQPVLRGKSIEQVIAEDNQIIESTIVKEVYPLDFTKIYQATRVFKIDNCKGRLVGSL